MPINYDEIMSLKSENIEISYTDKDSILYGLGVGLGVNVAADLYGLSKGNLAILSKEYLPSEAIIKKYNIGSKVMFPVEIVHPIIGGKAPAAPPITIF